MCPPELELRNPLTTTRVTEAQHRWVGCWCLAGKGSWEQDKGRPGTRGWEEAVAFYAAMRCCTESLCLRELYHFSHFLISTEVCGMDLLKVWLAWSLPGWLKPTSSYALHHPRLMYFSLEAYPSVSSCTSPAWRTGGTGLLRSTF